jgi:hypothetical protein
MDLGTALGITGVVIGLPALAMAVSPFCQMIWGRPKLAIKFVEFTGTEGKDLICSIVNIPIKNKILKWIGVRREAGDLYVSFDIIEEGSNRLLFGSIPGVINDAAARKLALVSRARPNFPSVVSVILCRNSKTIVHDPRGPKLIAINPGYYRARVLIACDDDSQIADKSMKIDNDMVKTNWI